MYHYCNNVSISATLRYCTGLYTKTELIHLICRMIFLHQLHALHSISVKPWVEQGTRPVRPARDQSSVWFECWSYMINNCLLFRQHFASQPRHIYRIIPPSVLDRKSVV